MVVGRRCEQSGGLLLNTPKVVWCLCCRTAQ